MRTAAALSLTVSLTVLCLLPVASCERPSTAPSCPVAARKSGWCEECGAGYVASIRIPSRALFETLDAHGHDIDPDAIRCGSCREAMRSDGFCRRCRFGFVDGKAYWSRLAWYLGRGEMLDPSALSCATCRRNAAGRGWCEACGTGSVGRLTVREKRDVEEAHRAFERLRAALRELPRCETCALAAFTGGRCRSHGPPAAVPGARKRREG